MGKAAQQFSQRVKGQIDQFARADTQLRDTAVAVKDHLTDRDALLKSAFNKYAQREDPESAIRVITQSPKPQTDARDMMRRMAGDRDAQEGFKKLLLESMLKDGGTNFTQREATWNTTKWKQIANEVFTVGEKERIDRLLAVGRRIEGGDMTTAKKWWRLTALMGTTIAATHLGGVVAGLAAFGGSHAYGALAIPALFKRHLVGRLQKSWSDSLDPNKLFAQAMTDPHFEMLMNRAMPGTVDQAITQSRADLAYVRRTVNAVNAIHDNTANKKEVVR
jgi:hypothetical protein